MKSWQFAVLGLLLLALPACRSRPGQQTVSLLERELREQEDEIYRLRNRLERCQEECGDGSVEGSTSKSSDSDESTPKLLLDFSGAKQTEGIGKSPKPSTEESKAAEAPPWDGSTPSLQSMPKTLPAPPDEPATDLGLPDLEMPRRTRPPEDGADGVDNRQVRRIVLNRQLSGGFDADGRPGHEGIVVVVEPRDARDRPIDVPAEASVVVIDPAIEDETGRVARWDLTATETAEYFGQSGSDHGMQLALRWPVGPPIHPDVQLFVRYVTSDGRKLEADMPMRIELPETERQASNARGWVPAEPSSPPSFRAKVPTLAARPSPPPEISASAPKEPAAVSGRPRWTPERR